MNDVGGGAPEPTAPSSKDKGPQFLGWGMKASPAFPVLAMLIYAASATFDRGSNFASVLASGVIVSGAALLVGTLLGFLFGLPRTIEKAGTESSLASNTNLDQISDWLTKILVGLGLVQLGKVEGGIESIAEAAAPALGGASGSMTLAVGLLVFSVIDGFLLGYLWTRIVVSARLKEAADNLDTVLKTSSPQPPPPAALPPPPAQ
jgi:hypothetical protein